MTAEKQKKGLASSRGNRGRMLQNFRQNVDALAAVAEREKCLNPIAIAGLFILFSNHL